MKKVILILLGLLSLPLTSHADVVVGINAPRVVIYFGDQDRRGYYWDGYYWRDPVWWNRHYPHYRHGDDRYGHPRRPLPQDYRDRQPPGYGQR